MAINVTNSKLRKPDYTSMTTEQSKMLLGSAYEDNDYGNIALLESRTDYDKEVKTTKRQKFLQLLPWILHLFFLISFITIFLVQNVRSLPVKQWPIIYNDLQLRDVVRTTAHNTKFEGRPTMDTEKAWHELLSVGVVSISEEEKSRLPFKTAANVFRQNEYVVELNVFHQLHCLHDLRKQVYSPRQILWTDNQPITWWEFHMNHCIEHLRQTILCNGDVTPQRFEWDEENYTYALDNTQQFKCRNWEDIWSWAKSRNTTGDSPMNLKGLEKDGKKSDAGEIWEKESQRLAQLID